MVHAIGVEGLWAASWLLVAVAVGSLVMAGHAVLTDAPDDVPRGTAPSLPTNAMLVWGGLALLSGIGAVWLWSVLPAGDDDADGFDLLE